MIHFKESCLLLVIVTLCQHALGSKDVGKIEQSRLILEYNWPNVFKGLKRLPHVVSCYHFYLTRPDGTHVIKECPDGESYDFPTRRCKDKELAKCWSKQFKTDLESRFVCPFPWGLYPDIVNCSKYFNCLNGKFFIRKCPVDSLFDKAERKCIDAKQAMCADKTDTVEPGYKCPYTWGFFTYAKDCSKYYECLQKNPSLRSCKRNMLFDNRKRKCLSKDIVECGTRFNPYENFDPSSSKSDLTTDLNLSVDIVSTLSSNSAHITDYSTSKESSQTSDDSTKSSKYRRDEYLSQHTTTEEHVSSSDSRNSKTGDSSGTTTEDSSDSIGSSNDTDSKQISSSDLSIKNISRLTGETTHIDSKQIGSSDSTTEEESDSTVSFNYTNSKQIDSSDPTAQNISRLAGEFTYMDSKLIDSTDLTAKNNSGSKSGLTYSDSKRIASSKDISSSTEEFINTDSKRIGLSDLTNKDNLRSTERFTYKDSKQISSLAETTEDVLHFTGEFIPTDSRIVDALDPAAKSMEDFTRE